MTAGRIGVLCLLLVYPTCGAAGGESVRRVDRRIAPDGVTRGWLLTYDNPDPDRSWERITGTLVVTRHTRVIRRIDAAADIKHWTFWRGGAEIAMEVGGLHGPTGCLLLSVRSGRTLAKVKENCAIEDATAPAWVKALARSEPGETAHAAR